jgi:hypothetical protein
VRGVSPELAESIREQEDCDAWERSFGEGERRAYAVPLDDALRFPCPECSARPGATCLTSNPVLNAWALANGEDFVHIGRRAWAIGLDATRFIFERGPKVY